jgi:hypothetical protein
MNGYFSAGLWPNDLTLAQNANAWWTTGIPPDDLVPPVPPVPPAGRGKRLYSRKAVRNAIMI